MTESNEKLSGEIAVTVTVFPMFYSPINWSKICAPALKTLLQTMCWMGNLMHLWRPRWP